MQVDDLNALMHMHCSIVNVQHYSTQHGFPGLVVISTWCEDPSESQRQLSGKHLMKTAAMNLRVLMQPLLQTVSSPTGHLSALQATLRQLALHASR